MYACLQGNTSSLGLDVMGIEANKRGLITVNDFYQTKVRMDVKCYTKMSRLALWMDVECYTNI